MRSACSQTWGVSELKALSTASAITTPFSLNHYISPHHLLKKKRKAFWRSSVWSVSTELWTTQRRPQQQFVFAIASNHSSPVSTSPPLWQFLGSKKSFRSMKNLIRWKHADQESCADHGYIVHSRFFPCNRESYVSSMYTYITSLITPPAPTAHSWRNRHDRK